MSMRQNSTLLDHDDRCERGSGGGYGCGNGESGEHGGENGVG